MCVVGALLPRQHPVSEATSHFFPQAISLALRTAPVRAMKQIEGPGKS